MMEAASLRRGGIDAYHALIISYPGGVRRDRRVGGDRRVCSNRSIRIVVSTAIVVSAATVVSVLTGIVSTTCLVSMMVSVATLVPSSAPLGGPRLRMKVRRIQSYFNAWR